MAKTSTIDGIPVYEALLSDEECGMIRISLVDAPAVLSGWQTFKKVQMYAVQDEEQRLVRGVVMRADFPIYRIDNKGGEYYIIYRADTIREMAEKYLAESRQNNVDTMHDGNEVDGVEMVQFFIKDSAKGINPEGFDDIADGSLFAEFHVTNDDVWAAIKDGTYQGFSLEGIFGFATEPNQQDIDEIVDGLAGEFSAANKDTKNTIMAKIERILELLRTRLEAEQKAEQKFGRVTTDKGIIEWPGEEDLKEGDSVEVVTEDDTREAAADGDYKTEDGKTIVVVDGKVAEIRDPEAEVAPEPSEEQEARRTEHLARKQKFEASYDEKIRRISEAVNAGLSPNEGAYIVSAGDDFAVADVWNEEEYSDKYYRYAVTWNEDGSANVGEGVECRQAFVPMDFDDSAAFGGKVESEVESLRAENAALKADLEAVRNAGVEATQQAQAEAETLSAEVESLRAQVTELKAQPAAKPAHEEVKEQSFRKTGAKGLDRVAELMSK